MQLCKTQAQLWQLFPTLLHTYLANPINTQHTANPWTLLKKLPPATNTLNIKLKKLDTNMLHIKLK